MNEVMGEVQKKMKLNFLRVVGMRIGQSIYLLNLDYVYRFNGIKGSSDFLWVELSGMEENCTSYCKISIYSSSGFQSEDQSDKWKNVKM